MKLLKKGRNLLPVIMILCAVDYSYGQQQNTTISQQTSKKSCAETGPTMQALPKKTKAVQVAVTNNEHPYEGTFQFISKKDQPQEIFATDIVKFVEENRLEEEDRIIQFSPNTKISIPSKRTIGRRNFKPYETLYSFE